MRPIAKSIIHHRAIHIRASHHRASRLLLALIFLISQPAAIAGAPLPVPSSSAAAVRALAAMALEKTAQARVALKKHHLGKMVQELREERILLDFLASDSSTGEINSLLHYLRIQMTLEDNREALPDLLPLFHALDRMPPSPMVDQARDQLKQVKDALENPDHAKALQLIDSLEKTLEIDAIDLPLQAASDELSHILNKLENNHEAPKVEELLLLEKNLSLLLAAGNAADIDTKQVRR